MVSSLQVLPSHSARLCLLRKKRLSRLDNPFGMHFIVTMLTTHELFEPRDGVQRQARIHASGHKHGSSPGRPWALLFYPPFHALVVDGHGVDIMGVLAAHVPHAPFPSLTPPPRGQHRLSLGIHIKSSSGFLVEIWSWR